MLRFVLGIFLSILATNWIYSEVNYFLPEVDQVARRVFNTVKIPTHDKWVDLFDEQRGSSFEKSILASAARQMPAHARSNQGFFNRQIRAAWNLRSVAELEDLVWDALVDISEEVPFLRGSNIFVSSHESRKIYYIPKVKVI